ncbi:MAG TPA: phosphatase PAP2 family protein [Gaiellaceae bacterium]|nr:phosphatase PAP2 family protein [Gaiellaceae bacterium]
MRASKAAAAAVAAGAFAVLAVLVAHGDLTSIDQWAVGHAMPGADFSGTSTLASAVIPLWDVHWHGVVHIVAELVTLPASFTPATVIVAAACLRLRGRAGATFAAAYAAGNVIELLVKATLTRPLLFAHGVHLASFDSSYPSGHTIRTVLVACAVAWAWPRLARWAIAWAVCSLALIELGGQHVPSDIVGGLLVAAALLLTTWSSCSRRPSTASRPSARAR